MNKVTHCILLILLGCMVFAVGNKSSAQVMRLSFADAWELAKSENPQIRQTELNIDKAKAQIGEAYSAAMPTLTASGYYQRNFLVPEMVTEFGGQTIKIKFEQENLFSAQLELAQPLYAAGKVGLALKIAQLYQQVTLEQQKQSLVETKLLITQLYFGALVALEWEKVATESYTQMQAHLEKVEEMHIQGIVSEYDLIRSRVQVSNFYPQVISAETSRKVAFEALAISLNIPYDQKLELTDDLFNFHVDKNDSDALYDIALNSRSELKQLTFQEEMLRKLQKIEKHGVYWPNLFLVGGYSASAQEPDYQWEDYYWIESLYAGVSLSIPLFDGFKASHRAQQVQVDIKTVQLQKEQFSRAINLELIQAQNKLDEATKNVQAQMEGRQLAEKGLSIAEVRYENGLATQLEVMDAQLALNQARTNELTARYEAITASAELDKALGRE